MDPVTVIIHDLFHLFLDNLGPLGLALVLLLGLGGGSYFWNRSRARKNADHVVATYATALGNITEALTESNKTLRETQIALTQAVNANLELRKSLDAATDLNTKLQARLDTLENEPNGTIPKLQARVTYLEGEVTRLQGLLTASEEQRKTIQAEMDRLTADLDRRAAEGREPACDDRATATGQGEPALSPASEKETPVTADSSGG